MPVTVEKENENPLGADDTKFILFSPAIFYRCCQSVARLCIIAFTFQRYLIIAINRKAKII
jgi:hypothetical protein